MVKKKENGVFSFFFFAPLTGAPQVLMTVLCVASPWYLPSGRPLARPQALGGTTGWFSRNPKRSMFGPFWEIPPTVESIERRRKCPVGPTFWSQV